MPNPAENDFSEWPDGTELAVAFNRAISEHFNGKPVGSLRIAHACGTVASAYLGSIRDPHARREALKRFCQATVVLAEAVAADDAAKDIEEGGRA